jgi:hypothetical protein
MNTAHQNQLNKWQNILTNHNIHHQITPDTTNLYCTNINNTYTFTVETPTGNSEYTAKT